MKPDKSKRNGPSRPCGWCGKTVRRPDRRTNNKNVYCSVKHKHLYHWFINDPPHPVSRVCKGCSVEFVMVLGFGARKEEVRRSHCSDLCRKIHQLGSIPSLVPHTKIIFCRCGAVEAIHKGGAQKQCKACVRAEGTARSTVRSLFCSYKSASAQKEIAMRGLALGKKLRRRARELGYG